MRSCLVVDDSSVVRKVARRIIEGLDFQVDEAADASDALRACEHAMPDFILLDWHLPEMDGIDLVAALRALEGGDQPTVVYCTSEVDVAHIARARRAGADEYLLKPFDRSIMEAKLHDIGML